MDRYAHRDDDWDDMELGLEQDFAFARFVSESGLKDMASKLDEQQKDCAKLDSTIACPSAFSE